MVNEKFYVGYSEINRDFKVSNVALLNMFQDITTIHGKIAGDSLKSSEGAWFLTAYKVKIFDRPDWEKYVNISTWSRGVKGFLASREFEIRDENGNLQVAALSNWVRINKNTQKIERISQELIDSYEKEEITNFENDWIQKLVECDKVDFEKEFTANRNYIDYHKHMNNVAYMKLAELILPEEVYKKSEICDFEIMYRNAIQCDETVVCQYTETDEYYNISVKNFDKTDLKAIIRLFKQNKKD